MKYINIIVVAAILLIAGSCLSFKARAETAYVPIDCGYNKCWRV